MKYLFNHLIEYLNDQHSGPEPGSIEWDLRKFFLATKFFFLPSNAFRGPDVTDQLLTRSTPDEIRILLKFRFFFWFFFARTVLREHSRDLFRAEY